MGVDHDGIEARLAELAGAGPVTLALGTDRLARLYIEAGVEPEFRVESSSFDAPNLVCADRYWNLRLTADPTVRMAAEAAGWVTEHVAEDSRRAIAEIWGLGYGFITADRTESLAAVAEASRELLHLPTDAALLVGLYHAGKLRAAFAGEELHQFLDTSPLIAAAGSDDPLIVALRSFAAHTSGIHTRQYARSLFDSAWQSWTTGAASRATADVALNGVAVAARTDSSLGEQLRDRAREALARYPDDHGFHARLAQGFYSCEELAVADKHIRAALALLPACGWRISHNYLQQQYVTLFDKIRHAQIQADHLAAAYDLRTATPEHDGDRTAGAVRILDNTGITDLGRALYAAGRGLRGIFHNPSSVIGTAARRG